MRFPVLALLLLCAACTTPVGPPIIPSLAPPVPVTPNGSAAGMYIPPPDAAGERNTPNKGLGEDEAIWHFRSAFNVAALNCLSPTHRILADDYNRFIAVHRVQLNTSNLAVDETFKRRYPAANGLRVRDTQMTDIYNYFALPPVTASFCDYMLTKSKEVSAIPSTQLGSYSVARLVEVDALFIAFYDAYDDYQRRLAAWKELYGKLGIVTVEPGRN